MGFLYLSVFRSQTEKPHIDAIAYKWMDTGQPPQVKMAWEHEKGERGMVSDFAQDFQFWNRKWQATPVGIDLQPQLALLADRCLNFGVLDFGERKWGYKPSLDLHNLLLLFNINASPVDGFMGEIPPAFVGARLDKFTRTRLATDSVPALVKLGRMNAALGAIQDEAAAFDKLWDYATSLAPGWGEAMAKGPQEDAGRPRTLGDEPTPWT